MEDAEDALEMIDILTFKSNELIEMLSKNNMTDEARQEKIIKFLTKQSQDPHLPPIDDFKQGELHHSKITHSIKID